MKGPSGKTALAGATDHTPPAASNYAAYFAAWLLPVFPAVKNMIINANGWTPFLTASLNAF